MRQRNIEANRMKEIRFSEIRKILNAAEELERGGADIVHLEIGRPDFDTPAHIKKAAKKALDDGRVHYTSNYGIPELRVAIANKLLVENNISVNPDNEIIVTVGTNEAVLLTMLALLDPGDEVIIPDPSWLHYFYCVRLAGARTVHVPIKAEQGFQVNPEDIESAITKKTKLIILNSPHNPTGVVLSKEVQQQIADIAIRYNLLVLSDEIYEKIIYDNAKHFSIGSIPGMEDRTLTVNGFSKAYAMTGWRLGYVAGPQKIIDALIRVHQYSTTCTTSFAQWGAVVAYSESQDCVAEMVEEFDRRRKYLLAGLEEIRLLSCVRPTGAFYTFPCVQEFHIPSEKLALHILYNSGVALVPGSAFGELGEGYVRISYANKIENIEKAVTRLQVLFRNLPSNL